MFPILVTLQRCRLPIDVFALITGEFGLLPMAVRVGLKTLSTRVGFAALKTSETAGISPLFGRRMSSHVELMSFQQFGRRRSEVKSNENRRKPELTRTNLNGFLTDRNRWDIGRPNSRGPHWRNADHSASQLLPLPSAPWQRN